MKRDHVYQHPSLVGHESLGYDAKYNRLSTYQVLNISDSYSASILGRKFMSDAAVNLEKRAVEDPESEKWFLECQSLIKRQLDYDAESEHYAVAGDDVHSWSLWAHRVGKYLAFFKDSVGQLHSYLIEKISDVWDFVNRLLLRVRINIEVFALY